MFKPYRSSAQGHGSRLIWDNTQMKLSPGDQIQVFLTVGGVPYVKTWVWKHVYDASFEDDVLSVGQMSKSLTMELIRDIHLYGDEEERPNP